VDHPFGLEQAATLHQFQIRDIALVRDFGDVRECDTGLVGGDGEFAALVGELESCRVLGRDRLLDELNVILGQPA